LKKALEKTGLSFLILFGASASATVFISVDDALKMSFPQCEVKRQTFYLTAEQLNEAKKLSSGEIDSSMVVRYEGQCSGDGSGFAYVDTHRVRTQPESLFVVLGRDHVLKKVEILSFREPTEYIPKAKWYEQFPQHKLDDDLQIKKGITPVTGASLTARATTQAVRRVLAVDQIVGQMVTGLPAK
jgi:electron transport complex protein RnfG